MVCRCLWMSIPSLNMAINLCRSQKGELHLFANKKEQTRCQQKTQTSLSGVPRQDWTQGAPLMHNPSFRSRFVASLFHWRKKNYQKFLFDWREMVKMSVSWRTLHVTLLPLHELLVGDRDTDAHTILLPSRNGAKLAFVTFKCEQWYVLQKKTKCAFQEFNKGEKYPSGSLARDLWPSLSIWDIMWHIEDGPDHLEFSTTPRNCTHFQRHSIELLVDIIMIVERRCDASFVAITWQLLGDNIPKLH